MARNTPIVMQRIEYWMHHLKRWSNRNTRDYMFAAALQSAIIVALENGTLKDETDAVDTVIKHFVVNMPLPPLGPGDKNDA